VPPQSQGKSFLQIMTGEKGVPLNDAAKGSTRVRSYIRTSGWKLIVHRKRLDMPGWERDELYDLNNDPAEKINVRADFPEIYAGLRERIREHLGSVPRLVDQVYTFPEYVDDLTRKKIRDTGYW